MDRLLSKTRDLLDRQLEDEVASNPLEALTTIGSLQRDIAGHQRAAVRAAVQHHSWGEIGAALGVSKQAAHQKFAKEWAEQLKDEIKAEGRAMKTAYRNGAKAEADDASARMNAVVAEFKSANSRRKG